MKKLSGIMIYGNQKWIQKIQYDSLKDQLEVAQNEITRLRGIEKDHLDDWKRVQDAERALQTVRDENEKMMNTDYWHDRYKIEKARADKWRNEYDLLAKENGKNLI